MLNSQLINGVTIDWGKIDRGSYLRDIPAISGVDHVDFTHPVPFFVGENGSGKSTLLEAIAIGYQFAGFSCIPVMAVAMPGRFLKNAQLVIAISVWILYAFDGGICCKCKNWKYAGWDRISNVTREDIL